MPQPDPETIAKLVQAHTDLGCWKRVGDEYRVLCGFCRTWCIAKVTMGDIGEVSASMFEHAVEYGLTMDQSATIQMHVTLSLHVHNHECVVGREAMLSAAANDA